MPARRLMSVSAPYVEPFRFESHFGRMSADCLNNRSAASMSPPA